MARFLKYQFDSEEQYQSVFDGAATTSSVNGLESTYIPGYTAVKLGNLVDVPAVLSEDGRTIITPAVMSTKYSVDIYWTDDEHTDFTPYRIYCDPSTMAHTFFGKEGEYAEEYNNRPQ